MEMKKKRQDLLFYKYLNIFIYEDKFILIVLNSEFHCQIYRDDFDSGLFLI